MQAHHTCHPAHEGTQNALVHKLQVSPVHCDGRPVTEKLHMPLEVSSPQQENAHDCGVFMLGAGCSLIRLSNNGYISQLRQLGNNDRGALQFMKSLMMQALSIELVD